MKASVVFFRRKRPFCINLLKVLINTKQVWDWQEPSVLHISFCFLKGNATRGKFQSWARSSSCFMTDTELHVCLPSFMDTLYCTARCWMIGTLWRWSLDLRLSCSQCRLNSDCQGKSLNKNLKTWSYQIVAITTVETWFFFLQAFVKERINLLSKTFLSRDSKNNFCINESVLVNSWVALKEPL